MSRRSGSARIIRVFVSSPGDVREERNVLDDVAASINRTDGQRFGFRLELLKWEARMAPRLGPNAQNVIDDQTPDYEIYIGILAHRFGTATGAYGSGTEKEFYDAITRWKVTSSPWILFYFSESKVDPHTLDLDQFARVRKFREQIETNDLGLYATYDGVKGTANSFYDKVSEHLRHVLHRSTPVAKVRTQPRKGPDPARYLRDLQDRTAYIDIRGLQVGTGRANRFAIDQLFMSLTTTGPTKPADTDKQNPSIDPRTVPLHEALAHDRLVIVGDPGSGKTTFVRRVAHALCQTQLGDVAAAADERVGVHDRLFPILLRISDLAQHILSGPHRMAPTTGEDSAAWLPHYLGVTSAACAWGLKADFFRRELQGGRCTVLLDGLDEAPDRSARERLSRLVENITRAYRGCRFVVTTRPAAYVGPVILADFVQTRIDPLAEEAVETFLSRWCNAIYPESENAARAHYQVLIEAIQARAEIRRMARNPMMLTALAVVHWNERRLPEERSDLYDSIITWLSRSREQRPGRTRAERAVVLLQELALALQNDPGGRKTHASKRWAAEKVAEKISDGPLTEEAITQAEHFLDEEELDSGIIVARGNEVWYWHLTFQEFLAAKAIASRLEAKQANILFADTEKIYRSEWREVLLLLAGTLHQQGKAKMDWLIGRILDELGLSPRLAAQARCFGLIGSVLRDLEPLEYKVSDDRYPALIDAVLSIFDRNRFRGVSIEERISAADALGQVGDPRIDFERKDYWVSIPEGIFLMGSQSTDRHKPNYSKEAEDDESPVHQVMLGPYRIARYPVTVGQYQQFIEDDGYRQQRWWKAGGFDQFTEPGNWPDQKLYPSRPVVEVSWYEAKAFCAWAGFRLPTEAEWERAARGTDAREFPWGPTAPNADLLNYVRNVGHLTPVGIYPLGNTPDGICDMAGNAWNWCHDHYSKYPAESVSNPQGPDHAPYRVPRGGSWASDAHGCRASFRFGAEHEWRCVDASFRVAAD